MKKKEHERLVNLAMQVVRKIMEKPKMNTKCKCGHSVFDHSDDTGCDAKGCTCSEGFEQVTSEIFTKAETEIDNLYREVNLLKTTNHRLRTEKDNDYDAALEWAAIWITGAQLLGRSEEVQEFATNMATSIRAAKRGLTLVKVPQSCEHGKGHCQCDNTRCPNYCD